MMYRPSLKRSKIEQIELYTKTYRPAHIEHQALRTTPACNSDLAVLCTEDAVVFPTCFYQQKEIPKNDAPLFTPLNYQWHQYPQDVKREMGREMEVEGVCQTGCHKELLWYFIGGVLHLWNRSECTVYRYKMHVETTCIQIGEIQSSSLHFKTRKLYIVAAGVANQFFLFGIDKQTFAMSDLKFYYHLPNSRCIQKICFVGENEIVAASDTSHYCHFDFTAETLISCSKLSVVQRVMPFIPLLYPSAATYIEQMLVGANDYLYVLVREERSVSWLKQRAQTAINKLMMRRQTVSDIAQRKWIEVYHINRVSNAIELKQKISDHEFVQKMRSKHPQICENKNSQLLKVASIYISKQSSMLSVVTKCGYFISLNQLQEVMLASSLVRAPPQSSIGVVGLYLPKRELEEDSVSKQNNVAYSLGLDSLTLMNDSLWFISENALQAVKSDRVECGQILDIKASGRQDEWLVFTKLGYYRVSRLKTYQVFISYSLVRNQLTLKFPEKSWRNDANFDLFVQNLAKMMGYDSICQSLIDCLLREQNKFTVAPSVLQLIEDQLRGHSNKNYRDWNHSLSRNISASPFNISERVGAQLWRTFLEMQSKNPKRESEPLTTRGIYCNAYWYALRNIFVRYSSPLLQIEAKNIKAKIGQVEDIIKLLQTLTKFFFLKSEKEMRQLSEAVANRNNILNKEKSLPRSPISKLKPVLLEKKQEEATEQTADQTIIAHHRQTRFTSESCIKLEETIVKSIKKLKTLVTIFIYLADLNEAEQLGSIRQILTSRKERANVRRHLLARVVDADRLQEFSQALPELQLGKALQYRKWQSYQQKNRKPQLANLAEIAKFISSQHLDKLKSIFESRLESLADLLLLYWDRLSAQLTIISKRELLMAKQTQILSEERSQMEAQTREYLCSQMKSVELQVQEIISKVIKDYINSTQDNYPRSQQTINQIIRIICSHQDNSLLSFAENAMGNAGLAEKLILLRRLKKKTETPISSSQLLSRTKLNEQRSVVQRQCMSNFEILMHNVNK